MRILTLLAGPVLSLAALTLTALPAVAQGAGWDVVEP